MHYYLYEIKNDINGKIYVGVHKTKVMDDGYMGSGKAIKAAILKYGFNNFTKTVLETFNSSDSMYAREKEVVNEEFIKNRNSVYNLKEGGVGGFDKTNPVTVAPFTGFKHSVGSKLQIGLSNVGKVRTEENKQLLKDSHWSKTDYESFIENSIISGAKAWEISEEERQKRIEKISNSQIKNRDKNLEDPNYIHHLVGKKKPIVECEYCGMSGSVNIIKGSHKKKCKLSIA